MVQSKPEPRVSIVHPTMTNIGGAERLIAILARELPAEIYTHSVLPDVHRYLPGIREYLHDLGARRFGRMLSTLSFNPATHSCDFMVYVTPKTIFHSLFHPDVPYLYYLTTPPRRTFVGEAMSVSDKLHGSIDNFWRWYVQQRVKPSWTVLISRTSYDRFCRVTGLTPRAYVYPPVDTQNYVWRPPGNFLLSVNRLDFLKRVEWQIRAFAKSGEKLVIVGEGPERTRLANLIKGMNLANVKMLGAVDDAQLLSLYSHCKGLVYTTKECEFGLTCIESLASGKPVFAVNEGGPTEYITHGVNGFLFDDSEHLRSLVQGFSTTDSARMRNACRKTAERFNSNVVIPKIRNIIQDIWREALG